MQPLHPYSLGTSYCTFSQAFFFEGCSSGKQGEGTQEQPWHRGTRLPHGEAKYTACTQQQLLFITVDIGAALRSGWGPVALGSVYTHNEAV